MKFIFIKKVKQKLVLVLLLLFMNSTVKPHFWGWKLMMVNDLKKTIKNIKNYTINITRSRTHHHMFQDSQQQKREYMDFLDIIMIIMSPFQFTNKLHKKNNILIISRLRIFHGDDYCVLLGCFTRAPCASMLCHVLLHFFFCCCSKHKN